jgi:hypothetical protein
MDFHISRIISRASGQKRIQFIMPMLKLRKKRLLLCWILHNAEIFAPTTGPKGEIVVIHGFG